MRRSSRILSGAASSTALLSVLLFVAPGTYADTDAETGRRGGDVAARNFSEYCAGELSAERRSRFEAAFAEAEAALLGGHVEEADAAMGRAFQAAYRGDADTEISIKCLGESIARRWWKARLEIDRQRSKQASARHRNLYSTLRATAVDHGTSAVVTLVGDMKPESFVSSVRVLESMVDRLDAERRFGAFMLAEEETLEDTCRAAVETLSRRAAKEHSVALAMEEPIFDRPADERERAAVEMAVDADAMIESIVGEPLETGIDSERILMRNRVRESRELLRAARTWNLERSTDSQSLPSSRRAKRRGDEMMDRAGRAGASVELRAAAYDAALAYYEFGGFVDEAAAATSRRAALEDALLDRRAEREARVERTAEKMKQEAEAIQRSVDDMRKSESQKKAFDDEAKAMEDELGF